MHFRVQMSCGVHGGCLAFFHACILLASSKGFLIANITHHAVSLTWQLANPA